MIWKRSTPGAYDPLRGSCEKQFVLTSYCCEQGNVATAQCKRTESSPLLSEAAVAKSINGDKHYLFLSRLTATPAPRGDREASGGSVGRR